MSQTTRRVRRSGALAALTLTSLVQAGVDVEVSGSTAVSLLINADADVGPDQLQAHVANVGDSRIVLARYDRVATARARFWSH